MFAAILTRVPALDSLAVRQPNSPTTNASVHAIARIRLIIGTTDLLSSLSRLTPVSSTLCEGNVSRAASSRRDDINQIGILAQRTVDCQQAGGFQNRLRDQQAIEWIAMMKR